MKNTFLFILTAWLSITTTVGQDNCNLKIGSNLAGPSDYGSEWPFVDIFKFSRFWVTHNHPDWTGTGPWSTDLHDSIPLDYDGYPTHVPFEVAGADTVQVVRTVWANSSQLQSGVYVLLYDGEGIIEFLGGAEIISQTPGRIEVMVEAGPNPAWNIISLELYQSTFGDHVRNIRFLSPGTEFTYENDPWSQEWLNKLEPFNTLRFMDWGLTNNSEQKHWSDRAQVENATYTISGVPYEWMIELSNRRESDAWVCIPHKATTDYVTQMATLFRDGLDPERKIYVEYSNETWNWMFWQTHYGLDSLDQNLTWPERLGPRIGEVMNIWHNVFGIESDRLVCVLGTQLGWFDIGYRILQQMELEGTDHLISAISPAAYMGLNHDSLASLGGGATSSDVVMNSREFTFDTAGYIMQGLYDHSQWAADKGKKLIYYEGGQHFTPEPWGTVQPYNQALMAAQENPLMYNLYSDLLDTLSNLTDEESLLMHFSFISPLWEDPNEGAYGNFGSLTSQFYQSEPYTNAPKYRALRDQINSCSNAVTVNEQKEKKSYLSVYPNPTSNQFVVETTSSAKMIISNALGKVVYEQIILGTTRVSTKNFGGSGLYNITLTGIDIPFSSTKKIVVF